MRNSHSRLKASVLAIALAAAPTVAFPAGLGKLSIQSGIGQPLRAEIDVAATAEELSTLTAKLAAPEAYKQAGMELTTSLSAIKFSVAKRPDGRSVLRLSSDRPMNDPFLEMLIELNWATGRVVREYKVLLDPPEAVLARQAPPPPVARPTESRPSTGVDEQTRARAQAQAAQPSAPAAQPAPSAPRAPASGYEVRRGDTLNRIASQTKYEGVSLDQMLVALFRNNREAFDGNNMHRLKAGRIINVPDRETVLATAPGDARRVVVAQSADFNAYRRKLAAATSAAPAPKEAPTQQIAGGKITPRVEDKAPLPVDTKDQLKVSKAEAAKEAEAKAKADKAVQGKIAALEEEVIAKDKALKEATSRLSQVEKNIQELQKLIELKNKNLAELQKQAAVKAEPPKKAEPLPAPPPPLPAPAVTPAPAPTPAPTPAPVVEAPKAVEPPPPPQVVPPPPPPAPAPPVIAEVKPEPPKPQPVPEVKPAEPKPAPTAEAPKVATPPQQPQPTEPGFMESLLHDRTALIGGGGALALLLGYVGYKLSRRRRDEAPMTGMDTSAPSSVGGTQSVFGATGGQSVDTSASSLQTDFSQSGIGAIDADEGVDPVAEADVYMAYGRDAQAEEILLDALKNDPTRHAIHVKLLEIYAQRKNLPQFETLAGELYAQTNGVGPEWEKAAALGRKLDPSNPLYGGGAKDALKPDHSDATVIVPAAAVSAAALKDTWTMPGELGQIASAIESHGPETSTVVLPLPPEGKPEDQPVSLDFDLGAEVEPAAATVRAPALGEGPALDFGAAGAEPTRTELAREQKKEPDLSEAPTLAFEPAPTASELASAPTDIDFKLAESTTESQPPGYMSKPAAPAEIDLLLTTSITGGRPMGPSSIVDLEATDFGGNLFQDLAAQAAAEAAKPQEPSTTLDLEKTEVGGNLLDFDFDLSESPQKAKADGVSPAVDLSGIDLDLPEADQVTQIAMPASSPASVATGIEAPEAEASHEADTKLELAQAYEEMGDKEGARELLQEVLKEGSTAQQDKARGMLAKLS